MLSMPRVLLADDDTEVRLGMVDLLDDLGLEVLQAESGPEAIELFRSRIVVSPIDLLVLDVHMPGCTGLEVFDVLRRERDELACIFYSGAATSDLETQALEAGARAFLRKPVQPALLRAQVRLALGDRAG